VTQAPQEEEDGRGPTLFFEHGAHKGEGRAFAFLQQVKEEGKGVTKTGHSRPEAHLNIKKGERGGMRPLLRIEGKKETLHRESTAPHGTGTQKKKKGKWVLPSSRSFCGTPEKERRKGRT